MTGRDAPYDVHEIPDFTLACGATLRPARIAYQTYGTLTEAKDNAILYPTWFSGRHWDNEWLIGPDKALDPDRWFIIVPNMLGNGLSSSPSNTPPPTSPTYASWAHAISRASIISNAHKTRTSNFGAKPSRAFAYAARASMPISATTTKATRPPPPTNSNACSINPSSCPPTSKINRRFFDL